MDERGPAGTATAGTTGAQPGAGVAGGGPAVTIRRAELDAVVFDLDGVITDTAAVHGAAWKRLFDDYLRARAERTGEPFVEFTTQDYRDHVDGKPRYDGVRDFLSSRGITLPEGDGGDETAAVPGEETVRGLGDRKNTFFNDHLREHGVDAYPTSVALLHALRDAGIGRAIASSSRNAVQVLQTAGLLDLFDAKMDGNDLEELGRPGKPAPDLFLVAAERLGVSPSRAAVVEDAVSGVEAGAAGRFRLVIGVDRHSDPEGLARWATVVVEDLGEVAVEGDPAVGGA